MKKIEDMKDYEFSEYIEKLNKKNDNKTYDEQGDEIKEDIVNMRKKKKANLAKYITFATGFAYTITAPVLLLLGIYFSLQKLYNFQTNEITIIILIFLGIITGYWNLYKDIKKITKEKSEENDSKNKEIK